MEEQQQQVEIKDGKKNYCMTMYAINKWNLRQEDLYVAKKGTI